MDGIHDLGGMHGFGRVEVEADEPAFHAPWEGRVLAMMLRLLGGGYFNIDAFRHGIERMDPAHYLRASYYERWRESVERNLVEAGVVTRDELEARRRGVRAGAPARPAAPAPPTPGLVREVERAPRYRRGDRVRARNLHPAGHTRLPRYVRGKRGRVALVHPAFVFPDTHAHGRGEQPQYVYNVRFDGRELWGDDAEPGTSVGVDLFESYLQAEERADG